MGKISEKVIFVVPILLLSFFSCIEIDMYIKLNDDGSGYAKVEYKILKSVYASSDRNSQLPLNEDKIADFLSKKEGVEVIRTGSSLDSPDFVRIWAEVKFKHISALSDNMIKYVIEDIGDKKEFRIIYRYWGETSKPEIVAQAVEGWESKVKVEVPTQIASTNGKIISPKVVEWTIPLSEIAGRSGELVLVVSWEKKKEGFFGKVKKLFGK